MATKVFGLTGGIGSGKSAVAARFRARHLPVVDADVLAREAVAPGTEGLRAVIAEFGEEILASDGQLDRKRLGATIFADASARARLNAIVHPQVRALALARFAELGARGEPLVCYEVPLLFEVGLQDSLRPVVVVHASEQTRVRRIVERDGLSEAEARARVAAQMPLSIKAERADHVIDNEGTLEELWVAADAVLDTICEALGIAPARYPRRG